MLRKGKTIEVLSDVTPHTDVYKKENYLTQHGEYILLKVVGYLISFCQNQHLKNRERDAYYLSVRTIHTMLRYINLLYFI